MEAFKHKKEEKADEEKGRVCLMDELKKWKERWAGKKKFSWGEEDLTFKKYLIKVEKSIPQNMGIYTVPKIQEQFYENFKYGSKRSSTKKLVEKEIQKLLTKKSRYIDIVELKDSWYEDKNSQKFTGEGIYFLIFELLETDFYSYIKTEGKFLTENELFRFAYSITDIYKKFEKKRIVHGDFSGPNLLIDTNEFTNVIVSDFGKVTSLSISKHDTPLFESDRGGDIFNFIRFFPLCFYGTKIFEDIKNVVIDGSGWFIDNPKSDVYKTFFRKISELLLQKNEYCDLPKRISKRFIKQDKRIKQHDKQIKQLQVITFVMVTFIAFLWWWK